MANKINIKSNADVQKLMEAIINDDDFILGEVTPIKYKLVLDGGRFEDFNPKLIDVDIAKIILSIQSNYDILLAELEEKFDIKIDEESKKLKFSIEKGSGILEALLESSGVLKKMESKHLMYVLIVAIIGFAGYEGYAKYIEHLNKKIEAEKTVALVQLEKNDRKDEREATEKKYNQLLDLTKDLAYNKTLQDASNKPKRDVLSILKDNEYIKVSKDTKITTADKPKYNYKKPAIEDIEEVVEEEYRIETINYLKPGKLIKFEGLSKSANSEIITAEQRMKLMDKADKQESVKVKLKIIKHPTTKQIKKIYVVDYIEK